MADDPNPALRAELVAAKDTVAPEIRGLKALVVIPQLSGELQLEIQNQIVSRNRRLNLIQMVINDLDDVIGALQALEADGYPNLPPAIIFPTIFDELRQDQVDINAALAIFAKEQGSIVLDLAHATTVPQEVPVPPGP